MVTRHRSQYSAIDGETCGAMVAGTSALAPTADQLAAAPAAWQAPFNLLPPYPEARRKPCSHCCGRRASPRPTSPHRDASLRHLATSPRHTSPHLPRLTSPPHLTALYRHASPRLISPPDRHASPHLTSPPRLTSPHRLALRAAVGPVDARAATTACARCHRRPALRVRARFRQLTAAPQLSGGSTLGCASRRNPT